MTKAELITALEGKFYKVFTPTLGQTLDNLNYYLVKVFDKVGDTLRDSNMAFYVEDEGTGSEVAYWSPNEPKPTSTERFEDKLQAYLNAKITDGTVEGAFIVESNAICENAIIKAIKDNAGILEEITLLLDKDAQGDVRYRLIG